MNPLNIFKLSNVIIPSEIREKLEARSLEPAVHDLLGKVIFDLAIDKPLWVFTAKPVHSFRNAKGVIETFVVTQDGEELGELAHTWYRNNYAVAVSNPRIAAKRERTSSYRTADAAKAVATTKKMFMRKNTSEILKQALKDAGDTIQNQKYDKQRLVSVNERAVENAGTKFATGYGKTMFMKYLQDTNNKQVLKAVVDFETYTADMVTIEDLERKFSENKTALIVKTEGKYLVKIGDVLNVCTDNELSHEIRGKLGMLKLVEREHILTDMGCRVNDEVFIILLTEEPNEIQSSTGV